MKHIFYSAALLLATLAGTAQDIDRSKAPKPGPAPVINIADPASFMLPNGLKVFVVTNKKLPQVSATLTIDRDPVFEGDKAGLISMTGSLMRRGTAKMDKSTLDEAVDFLGGELSTSSSSVSASALKKSFPKLMELMADVALRPAFDSRELETVRKQTLSGLVQAKDDPNAIANNVSSMLMYGKDHPYGEVETEKSVQRVTVADIKKYHQTYWKPNIAYLILVGDITVEEARSMATRHFGSWAKAAVPAGKYNPVAAPGKTYVAVVDRPSSVQSVISINAPVQLKPGAPDAIPASVMANVLGGGFSSRLNQNLREKYGFTYGAGGDVSPDKLVGSFSASASVRNEKTDSAVGQFLYEFKRIRSEIASDSEVTALKNYMSGGFARSLENPATVAAFALNVARYQLPKDYYRTYLTRLAAVKPTDVKDMAGKYVPANNLIITIVGNAREIAKGLEKYGEVKYFDIDGNPIAAPVVKEVSGDVTAESVLRKALQAYGGEEAIAAIKDASLTGTMGLMGQTFAYVQQHVMPDGYFAAIKMGEMALMTQKKAGSEYSASMQGASMPVEGDAKADLDAKAMLYEERYYLSTPGYQFELQGIEAVEGKEAYKMKITSPGGSTSTSFFDVATGLRVKDMREQELGPMGKVVMTTTFKEYKAYNGVQIPVKVNIDAGPLKQDIDITDVKINTGLKKEDLK